MSEYKSVSRRKVASCDLSISYSNKCHGKICRLSYTSWCPTCDKESPRRRCRSESIETCRRKGKEMKTFSPRKYQKDQEFENMDLDYETKELRYESYRIRSNLCELPTTYISNNCQLTKLVGDCQNDCIDSSDKSSKIYENCFKSFDIHNQALNFGDMLEKQDKDKKLLPNHEENDNYKIISKVNCKVDHIKPHFPPKSADYRRKTPSLNVSKVNSSNGLITVNNHKALSDFLEKAKVHHISRETTNYQPFKNSKEVYNKLLEAEAKNAHIVNKINLIESFKNPVENTKKVIPVNSPIKDSQSNQILAKSPSPDNQNRTYSNNLNFVNQKSLFEKQVCRFEDLKNQLEKQKSILECQMAYFEQKKNDRPYSSPPWLQNSASKAGFQKPVKITKTNIGNMEMLVGGTPVTYDTSTYYDNVKDVSSLREKYYKEIEVLKMRMNELRAKSIPKQPPRNENGIIKASKSNAGSNDVINDIVKKTNLSVLKKKDLKSASKVSLKTKKLNLNKIKRCRSKFLNTTVSDSDSECSDSDSYEAIVDVTDSVESVNSNIDAAVSNCRPQNNGKGDADDGQWPLRASLFPYIPPYIRFNSHDQEPNKLPTGRKYLKWKLTNITPILVRNTLTSTGFRLIRSEFSRESTEWVGTWGKHMKSPMFRGLRENQKLNHFPGTFQVGRKDRLWRNLQRLMLIYGHKEFGFIPRTYILPQEIKILKQNWRNSTEEEKWIIKPPASARGTGIRIIHKWSQLPKRVNLIVQKYISNPFLINGSKFDLRLYVLVTSFDPLRIYLYPDGLVRFASVQYNDSNKNLKDRYMHLTNYSINKMSSNYTANDDANSFQGHKWTLSKLWEYFQIRKVDTKDMWKSLKQLVIKTIISGENTIVPLGRENMSNRYNCYELFGIDVLLDEKLNPWLLEVNISPSLHSQSPLDAHVKGPMVQSLFNLAQFHLPSKIAKAGYKTECYNPKLYSIYLLKKERKKHLRFTAMERREEYLSTILDTLTGDDVRRLTQAEDELQVIGNFERIFPTSDTHNYLKFIEPRYYNRLFDAWEVKYEKNRKAGIKLLQDLCETKIHLKVANPPKVVQNLPNINLPEGEITQEGPERLNNAPSHSLLNFNSVKDEHSTLYNRLLGQSLEQHQNDTETNVQLHTCPLKVNEVQPCVAASVV